MTKNLACESAPSNASRHGRLGRDLGLVAAVLIFALCTHRSLAAENQYVVGLSDKDSPSDAATASPASLDAWRIIHTKGADGAPDTTAILRVADLARSDPRLAGLMLRCSKQGVEPVIVVVEPFSPQAHPKITLRADEQEFYFEGKPLPNGTGLRVPVDGLDLVRGPWKGARDVMIKISDGGAEISGVVELSGLTNAIQSLANCAEK